jgi:hypothetical protein
MTIGKRLLIAGILVVPVVLVSLGAIHMPGTGASLPASGTPSIRVRRGHVTIAVTARGDLQGGNPEILTAPAVAQDSLTVTFLRQPGELVKAGDVVVELDTTQQEYNLREAELDLAESQQKIAQAEAENLASDEEARNALEAARLQVRLAEIEGQKNPMLSRNQSRENEIALEAARNRLKQAEQDLVNKKTTTAAGMAIQRAAEARTRMLADMARRNIESMTLRATTSGYVNLQPDTGSTINMIFALSGGTLPVIQTGSTVRPGMPLAQIPDLSSWEVTATVSELDRGHLAVGQAASVSVPALGGRQYPAHVKILGSPSGQAWDRSFDCRIALDRTGPELRPGMSVEIVIIAETLADVLWVPSQALFERDGKPFVYLKTANGFAQRDVTLVKRSESQAVLTGVKEGDLVALANPSEQLKSASEDHGAMRAIPK